MDFHGKIVLQSKIKAFESTAVDKLHGVKALLYHDGSLTVIRTKRVGNGALE